MQWFSSPVRIALFVWLTLCLFAQPQSRGTGTPAVSNSDTGYRFGSIEAKVDNLATQLAQMTVKIDQITERLGRLEERVDWLRNAMTGLYAIVAAAIIIPLVQRAFSRPQQPRPDDESIDRAVHKALGKYITSATPLHEPPEFIEKSRERFDVLTRGLTQLREEHADDPELQHRIDLILRQARTRLVHKSE